MCRRSFEVGFSSNVAIKVGEKIYAGYASSEESFKLEGVVISPNLARFKVPSDFRPRVSTNITCNYGLTQFQKTDIKLQLVFVFGEFQL
jgi:hypothetical protein